MQRIKNGSRRQSIKPWPKISLSIKGQRRGNSEVLHTISPLGVRVQIHTIITWILIFVAILNKIDTNLLSVVQVAPGESRNQPISVSDAGIRVIGNLHAQPNTEISKLINKNSSSSVCTGT